MSLPITPENSFSHHSSTPNNKNNQSGSRRRNRRSNKKLAATTATTSTVSEGGANNSTSNLTTPSKSTTPIPLHQQQTQQQSPAIDRLFTACQKGDVESVLEASHSSGFSFLSNSRHRDNFSPLQEACHFKQLSVVKVILEEAMREHEIENYDLEETKNNNNNNNKILQELLHHTTKSGGQNALHIATASGATDIVKLLVEDYGAKIDVEDGHQNCALLIAAREGFFEIVEFILKKTQNDLRIINHKNADLATAFSVSASNGSVECAKLLLAAHADPNLGPVHPLIVASQNGRTELTKMIVKHLIEKDTNFDINKIKQRTGASCLMIAAQEGRCDIVKFLVEEAGADIAMSTEDGWTALTYAAFKNKPETVSLILDSCPNEDVLNEILNKKITSANNMNAIEIAKKRNCSEVLSLIESKQNTIINKVEVEAATTTASTSSKDIKDLDGESKNLQIEKLEQELSNLKKMLSDSRAEKAAVEEKLNKKQINEDSSFSTKQHHHSSNQQQQEIQSLRDENNRLQLRVEELENEIEELKNIVLSASPSRNANNQEEASPSSSSPSNNTTSDEIMQVMNELTQQLKRERETQSKLQDEVSILKSKVVVAENNTRTNNNNSNHPHQTPNRRRGSLIISPDVEVSQKSETGTKNNDVVISPVVSRDNVEQQQQQPPAITSPSSSSASYHQQQREQQNPVEKKELEETIIRLRKHIKEGETQLEKEKQMRKREQAENSNKLDLIQKETEQKSEIEIEKLKNQLADAKKGGDNNAGFSKKSNDNASSSMMMFVTPVIALGVGFGLAKVLASSSSGKK